MIGLVSILLAAESQRVWIPPGRYRPTVPPSPGETEIPVRPFYMAVTPVTNAMFARFLVGAVGWHRDQVDRLFAEPGYLKSWDQADFYGSGVSAGAPVTEVSWFAARAYCTGQGGRLPTEAEWEWAALDPALTEQALAWYGQPTPVRLPDVGGTPNRNGVRDLQLVWEWVEDFNGALVSSDVRDVGAKFCGGGAADAQNVEDYASFMRLAFRSALTADATVRNLGFRCVWDSPA